ncbi:IS3 family transposase [Streptomyces sp. NPDC004051]
MPRSYPAEFRRKALDLVEAGRQIRQIAHDLGISEQTIYVWRRQHLIDTGRLPGPASEDQAELVAARLQIAELEAELAVHRRAAELIGKVEPPKKRRFEAVAVMAGEGLSVQTATRVLNVSESGYYAWRSRPPSPRSLRHAWLTEAINTIHTASHGSYSIRRVHAELRLEHGIFVSHGTVMPLMQRASLTGLPGNRLRRPRHDTPTAADLVDRKFTSSAPDKLWVTDITEHSTREGKVYCAVVLDTYSRRVVGWSIDSTQTAALVTKALNMAISNRRPTAGTVIHSDHGVQFTSWAFTERARASGLASLMGTIGDCYDSVRQCSFCCSSHLKTSDLLYWTFAFLPRPSL